MAFTKCWIGRAAYVRVQYPVNCETLHTIFPIIQYVVSYVRTYEFMCTKSIIQNSTHFYSRNSGTVGNVGKTKGIVIHCSGCAHVRIWAKLSTCIYTHMNMCQILTVHNSQCWNAQILWGLHSYVLYIVLSCTLSFPAAHSLLPLPDTSSIRAGWCWKRKNTSWLSPTAQTGQCLQTCSGQQQTTIPTVIAAGMVQKWFTFCTLSICENIVRALHSEILGGFCMARYVAALYESENSSSQKLLNDVVVKWCTIHMFQCNLQKLEFVCLLPIYI